MRCEKREVRTLERMGEDQKIEVRMRVKKRRGRVPEFGQSDKLLVCDNKSFKISIMLYEHQGVPHGTYPHCHAPEGSALTIVSIQTLGCRFNVAE
jgi:hypothetical protein